MGIGRVFEGVTIGIGRGASGGRGCGAGCGGMMAGRWSVACELVEWISWGGLAF